MELVKLIKKIFQLAKSCDQSLTYLREGTVVPEVALVGEAVTDVTELALLDVLLDGVEVLLLGNLCKTIEVSIH